MRLLIAMAEQREVFLKVLESESACANVADGTKPREAPACI